MHLAQVNLARALAPLDSVRLADFARALEPMNLLAERSPGFVWRMEGADEATAPALKVYPDGEVLINLSVWRSVETLRDYTYHSGHAHYVKRRKEWFSAFGRPHYALWWVEAGHRPTPEEARARLDRLHEAGPTAEAFTFTHVFPQP